MEEGDVVISQARGARFAVLYGAMLVLVTVSPVAAQPTQDHAGQYAEADIVYGATIYAAQCAMCHGANGDEVGGVDLSTGQFRRATSDRALNRLFATGISEMGMPAFEFDSAERTGIIAYLRNMGSFDAKAVTIGDADRGRDVFEGSSACTSCHSVDGTGAGIAPDLSNIGTMRAASAIQSSVLNPNSAMVPINRPIRAVTNEGVVINGRRLNEDTYTVQLIDERGRLVSLVKSDLNEYTVLTTSPMPSYEGKLTPDEVADLLAYLLSLKGF